MPSPRDEFINGIRAELSIVVGVIPFGLIFGVLALQAGLPQSMAMAMSSVVFAGSSQFIGAPMLGAGDPALVILLTTFVVNLRHALYSATLAPHVKHLARKWKFGLAYLLTDEAFAATVIRYQQSDAGPNKHWFWLGAGLTLWTSWQLSTAVGVFLGAQVPATWALDFTLALTFIGIIVPTIKDRPGLVSAIAAGITALFAADLPLRSGLLLAAAVGIGAGMWLEEMKRKPVIRD